MKNLTRRFSILALTLAMPIAHAHDPAEHAKEAAAAKAGPDCAAMKDMDRSKMDPNDPVMKAMTAKCGHAGDHGAKDAAHTPAGETPKHEPHEGH